LRRESQQATTFWHCVWHCGHVFHFSEEEEEEEEGDDFIDEEDFMK
jgi:hypothetical protein